MFSLEEKQELEQKESEIWKILSDGNITYGKAKHIINRISAELQKDGDTYLIKSKLENVSPTRTTDHH